jgi:hypothetical protein
VHTELAVLEAGGLLGFVLLPEELEGDARVPELLVEGGPVGEWPDGRSPRPAVEAGFERAVIELGW